MALYDDINSGCWSPDSQILMFDGSSKRADEIKMGDVVMTYDSSNPIDEFGAVQVSMVPVLCVVETKIPGGKIKMCTLPSGLKITPWHPIKKDAINWVFPNTIISPEIEEHNSIFNLILPCGHIPVISNTPCITLGHGYTEGILKHPYFGTRKVIDDLSKINGFKEGHLIVYPSWFKREGPPLDNSGINTINKIEDPTNIDYDHQALIEILYSAK